MNPAGKRGGKTNLVAEGDDPVWRRGRGEEGGHEALDAGFLSRRGQGDLVAGIKDGERRDDHVNPLESLDEVFLRAGKVGCHDGDAALLESLVSGAVDGRLAGKGRDLLSRC